MAKDIHPAGIYGSDLDNREFLLAGRGRSALCWRGCGCGFGGGLGLSGGFIKFRN